MECPEPEPVVCPELPVADVEIDSDIKKLHINKHLKKNRGRIKLTLDYKDAVIELLDGEEVEVKMQLIQDGKITELTGVKAYGE